MTKSHARLKPIQVAIDDLLLDPNNPRFVENLRLEAEVTDDEVVGRQVDVLKKFRTNAGDEGADESLDESFFGVSDLMESMRQIGFVSVDRVVVRKLTPTTAPKTPKYLVVEGNRRVSAAKKLREQDKYETHPKKKLGPDRAKSLDTLDVLLLETDGLSPDELHERVGVILGLRHYGSLLEWEPMPKAKNIHNEYMDAPPPLAEFALNSERASGVSRRLSVKRSDVIHALRTYVAYEQLSDAFPAAPPQPKHYSLLQNLLTNAKLSGSGYIIQDQKSGQLADLEKVNRICQFENRDTLPAKKKILAEPKSVKSLASLVDAAYGDREPAVQGYATSLLLDVESGARTLEDATDNLKSFTTIRDWTVALGKLLKKQAEGLPLADYVPDGNDRLAFEAAEKAFRNIRKILDL